MYAAWRAGLPFPIQATSLSEIKASCIGRHDRRI
jgi:hypothetical protein